MNDKESLIFLSTIGPHLRNERTTEKWAYTLISTQNLEFINMDLSGGYDQISHLGPHL